MPKPKKKPIVAMFTPRQKTKLEKLGKAHKLKARPYVEKIVEEHLLKN